MKSVSLAAVVLLAMIANSAAHAGGCAAEISAYRRAHGLSAVRADAALVRIARRQAAAMARAETVSHNVKGNFLCQDRASPSPAGSRECRGRLSDLRGNDQAMECEQRASRQSSDAGCAACRRRVGRKAIIALSTLLGHGDYGLRRIRGCGPTIYFLHSG